MRRTSCIVMYIRLVRRVLLLMLVLCLLLICLRPLPFTANDLDFGERASQTIANGFYSFQPSIDLSSFEITTDELAELFAGIIKDDPYLFFVDDRLPFSYDKSGRVLSIKPIYKMTKTEAEAAWSYCRMMVSELARGVEGNDAEIALELHDRICSEYLYDDLLESDNIYDLFLSGKGTCQAYTLIYIAALRECGIKSHFAASDTISHMWNLVQVDGEWYHVDITWDDPASGGEVSRRHFLCSDKTASERGHRDWYSSIDVECLSEKYLDFDFDSGNREKSEGDGAKDGDNCVMFDVLHSRTVLLEKRDFGEKLFRLHGLCVKGEDAGDQEESSERK